MIYVDFSYLAISCYFSQERECAEVKDDEYRKHIVHTLFSINNKHKHKFGDMILCCEASKSWRYDIYSHYKALRKLQRADDHVKWAEINRLKSMLQREFAEHQVFKVVIAQNAEGDDIIAVLAKHVQLPSLIVSEDKDYHQLHRYPYISQWSHRRSVVYRNPDPDADLREKIISGDRGDSIPNIHSRDDVFILKERQTVVSAKKFKRYDENFFIDDKVGIPAEFQKNYERNQKLINFEYIPESVQQAVLESFKTSRSGGNVWDGDRTLYLMQSGINPTTF